VSVVETKSRRKKQPTPASWKRGQSGNPKGTPKKAWRWAQVLREAAENLGKDGREYKVAIAEALIKEALKGNVTAIKEFADRVDGRSRQSVELLTPEREPIDPHSLVAFRIRKFLKTRGLKPDFDRHHLQAIEATKY
jgi:hypothetical protein